MGILDTIEGMAGQAMGGGEGGQGSFGGGQFQVPQDASEQGRVAGSFLQQANEHPGGLGGIMDMFRNNGMGQHVDQWQTGQMQQATPDQVQNGLGGGMLDQIAQRAGVSPTTAKVALAAVLPMILSHMTQGGQQAPPAPGGGAFGGLAGSLLSRIL
jgi:uncharacterized protein YidB (DUF937 family)